MTVPSTRRFAIEGLLAPRSVAVLGVDSADGVRVLENLRSGNFAGQIWAGNDVASLAGVPDLAVIAGPAPLLAGWLSELAVRGCPVAVVTGPAAGLAEAGRAAGLRVLGPNAFGVAVPRLGLNASLSHIPVPAGHVGLVTQSSSLARAVVDWAGPNGVGFSAVVGIGGNADIGFASVLDYLARDADTRLILLDIRRVRDRGAFISAARAASRLRPVVALRPGGRLLDESGRADAVFEAALNRAGVFVVQRTSAFLAAAETLIRARPLRGEALAIVTNAIGPGRLAADAALRAGIKLAILPPEAQAGLTASLPADLVYGLIYAGAAAPTDVASIAAMVSAVPSVGGVLVVLAPGGAGDAAAVQSVIAAGQTVRLPVLTCVMGETTGAGLRRLLAEAGLPVFATPEQAVEGFSHLLRDRRARLAARELPPGRMLDVAPDRVAVARILAQPAADGRLALTSRESLAVLAGYGLGSAPPDTAAGQAGPVAALHVHEDASFGPAIGLGLPGQIPAYGLPPLNLVLARDLAGRAGLGAMADSAAGALVRISQLVVDLPQVSAVDIPSLHLDAQGALAGDAVICLHPLGQLSELAIAPYPDQLVHRFFAQGREFVIRPIRPEDAEAHAALVSRVPPEDLRFRFFSSLRSVAPEQMVRLTQIDYEREMAFVAIRDLVTVGVARVVCDGDCGEFAILVQPDAKGVGLARHLMECLIAWGRGRGLSRITGQVLSDNHAMLGFVRHLGFAIRGLAGETDVVEAVLRCNN